MSAATARGALTGHVWTILPHVTGLLSARAPAWQPWATWVEDARVGRVPLTGKLSSTPKSSELVILVHGLGGSADSSYMKQMARALESSGLACLRLNLRGAGGDGSDFYHAGISSDLSRVVRSQSLSRFAAIYLLGFSLGGHIALRYACCDPDPRVRALVAVSAPLDLARTAAELDEPATTPYRRHVLKGLKQMYATVAERRRVEVPVAAARRIDSIIEWDERIVAPRHGFRGAFHYYSCASVGPLLRALSRPALYVGARHDPMVREQSVLPSLLGASPLLDVRWVERGGHVGFPNDLDLGIRGPRGLAQQVISWFGSAELTNRRWRRPK